MPSLDAAGDLVSDKTLSIFVGHMQEAPLVQQSKLRTHCRLFVLKSTVLEIDLLWGEGQRVGEGAMSVGSPTEPRGLFQYLK